MNGLTPAIQMIFMQLSARFLQINLTDAQKKLIQHPVSQSVLLFFMFYVASRNILLSFGMVVLYYITITILLNEQNPFNLYSRPWLMKEGFLQEDTVETLKETYMENLHYL